MVPAQIIKMPFRPELHNEAPEAPVWPRMVACPAVRHPSRPKVRYRPRSLFVPSNQAHPENAFTQIERNETSYWEQRTALAAKDRATRRKKAAIYTGVAIAGLMTLAGSYTVTRQPSPPAQVAVLNLELPQVLPEMTVDAPVIESVARFSPPAQAPVLGAPQPGIMNLAPQSLQPPRATLLPTFNLQTARTPAIVTSAPMTAPQQDDAFVCQSCAPAFPQFNQVRFAIQVTDATAERVQNLMRDLGQYERDLITSAIPIVDNQVRFYRAEDAQAARVLASRLDADLVDLTWFAPGSDIAKIDILLSTPSTPAVPADAL